MIPKLPVITLINGLVVANYSSPHTFEFEDGSVLGACNKDRCMITELIPLETIHSRCLTHIDIVLRYNMTWFLEEEFKQILESKPLWDVIITPLPVMKAWAEQRKRNNILPYGPWRTGRLVDRYNKILSISKFCIV